MAVTSLFPTLLKPLETEARQTEVGYDLGMLSSREATRVSLSADPEGEAPRSSEHKNPDIIPEEE